MCECAVQRVNAWDYSIADGEVYDSFFIRQKMGGDR